MPERGSDKQGIIMKDKYTILIADRNPHVRAFLKREMSAEGYRIQLAGNSSEVLKWAFGPDLLHLLIIDPDLPDADELDILRKLEDRIPPLLIIVHSCNSDYSKRPEILGTAIFVEKGGKSIEQLKSVAAKILQSDNRQYLGTPEGKRPPQSGNLNEIG